MFMVRKLFKSIESKENSDYADYKRQMAADDRSQLKVFILECVDKKREDVFQNTFDNQFLYHDFNFEAKEDFQIQGKLVKKIRICTPLETDDLIDKASPKLPLCIYISFANGTKLTASSNNPKFFNFLQTINKPVKTFARMDVTNIDWERHTVSEVYEVNKRYNPDANYKNLHLEMRIAILHITKKSKNINIIDGGCGNGRFLKYFEKTLALYEIKKNVKLLGFDFNSKNIDECKNNYRGSCCFIQGNLMNIDNIIRESKAAKRLHQKAPTVLVLSGSLTRRVLPNAFSALQILQKVIKENDVDYIIGGGQEIPLINHFIVKRIGLKPVVHPSISWVAYPEINFFFYQRFSFKEILQNKINKINNKNVLDLSLSPNPVLLLDALEKSKALKRDLVIDLSFCVLSQELIATLNKLHEKGLRLKLIFWHWDKQTVLQFFGMFFSKFEIATKIVKTESYLMAPKAFFTAMQPNMRLFPVKPTIEFKTEAKSEAPDDVQRLANFITHFPSEIDEDFIYNYFGAVAKLPLEKSNYEDAKNRVWKVQESLSLELSCEVKTRDELLKYYQQIKEEASKGEFTHLSELVYIYQKQLFHNTLDKRRYVVQEILVDSNLSEEFNLYHHLAKIRPDIFKPNVMKLFCEFRLKTVMLRIPITKYEVKRAMSESKKAELEKAKELFHKLWEQDVEVKLDRTMRVMN